MSTMDHLRLVYINRLWKEPAAEAQTLIDGETDEELVELKRVALEEYLFEMAAVFARVLNERSAAKATEIFTDDTKRTAAYTAAVLRRDSDAQ